MERVVDGTRHVPLGPGLAVVRLRVASEDVVVLRGILSGYEGLASAHGDESGIVALLTPESNLAELEALLLDLAREVPIAWLERARSKSEALEPDR